MKKIYTIRDEGEQQAHLWEGHRIEDEVVACEARTIAPHLLTLLPHDEEVLEAGCGLGAWVIYLRERGYRISGLDHNREVITSLLARDPGLPVVAGDILRLPFLDNSLGAYISLGVVEHFEEGAARALKEAYRVLRPRGFLFLTVPSNNLFRRIIAHPLRSVYLLVHRLRGRRLHFAEYRYSSGEVRRMVTDAGFGVIDTGVDDFSPETMSLTLWSEFPFLRQGPGPYSLNSAGRILARILKRFSPVILASGVFVIARKP